MTRFGRKTRDFSRDQQGRGQLTLLEHALCPLQSESSLRQRVHRSEYFFMDKHRHQRRASVRIDTPQGLSANDEFFLWGLLGLTLSQRDPSFDFYATPHYCLRQLGCLSARSKGGKNYSLFREAIGRLAAVRYQNDRFYDPIRREHRAVSFGFFSYSLPLTSNSSRAWRIVWDPLFFEICQASGGHMRFDLSVYRELDCASRRLFLLLKKIFWRRTVSPVFDVRHLAVDAIGYSPGLETRTLKAKVKQCAAKLLARGIVALPDESQYRWFQKRGKGLYSIQFHRGPYFGQTHQVSRPHLLDNSPEVEPLRSIGFDEKAIRRILNQFTPPTIQVWADVTLAALEHKGSRFFGRSPQAFFMNNVQQAAQGRRSPPDWFHKIHKLEQHREAKRSRQKRAETESHQSLEIADSDREVFEKVLEEMLEQFRIAGQSEPEALRNAERFARDHVHRRNRKEFQPARPLAEILGK